MPPSVPSAVVLPRCPNRCERPAASAREGRRAARSQETRDGTESAVLSWRFLNGLRESQQASIVEKESHPAASAPPAPTPVCCTLPALPVPSCPVLSKPRIAAKWREDASWGRDIGRYIGDGYLPEELGPKLQGLERIEQLFVLQRAMAHRIRYEKGKVTVKREPGKCGLNKPVTFASNIWNRGYANCAGHCVVFASAMKALGIPYCVVTLRSKMKGKPKHAIMQVGFPEETDIRRVSRRATELWAQFYGDTVQVNAYHRQFRLYSGLKFVRSRMGSEAAKRKGLGHWLILDPVAKVGCYHHLVKNGYMTQSKKAFGFSSKPQIKSWQRAEDEAHESSSDSGSDTLDVDVQSA